MTINVDAAFTMMEPVGILTVLLAKNYSKILEIVNFKYIFCQSFTNHMSEQHNDSGNGDKMVKPEFLLPTYVMQPVFYYIVPNN